MLHTRTSVAVGCFLLVLLVSVGNIPAAGTSEPSGQSSFFLERSLVSSGGCLGSGPTGTGNGTLGQPTILSQGVGGDRILRTGLWAWRSATVSGIQAQYAGPATDRLFQNFPNPLKASTTIEYVLSADCMVSVSVFNVNGQRVRTLVSAVQPPGRHSAVWDGRDDTGREVSPGVYFYRLDAGDYRTVSKMVIAR
jgi:hypothetical protein